MLTEGTTLQDGKFVVGPRLGAGGFGVTYRATHVRLRAPVVIKEFFPRTQVHRRAGEREVEVIGESAAFERGLRMFLREAELLFSLRHPNIVRVTDFFEEGGTAYIVMEYLEGRSMAEELRALGAGGLTDERLREWMGSLVDALAAIHRRGICHLDIKPDNVMCLTDGTVKLIDFGAAKQGTTLATQSRFVLTPAYAPPEMFEESSYGPESDIYELGVLLHLLVTGALPPTALARMTSRARFFPREIGGGYGILIDQALRLNRADRPRDVTRWWTGSGGESAPSVTGGASAALSRPAPTAATSRVTNPTDVLRTHRQRAEADDPLALLFVRSGVSVIITLLITAGVFATGIGGGVLLMGVLGGNRNTGSSDTGGPAVAFLGGCALCAAGYFLNRWKSSLQ